MLPLAYQNQRSAIAWVQLVRPQTLREIEISPQGLSRLYLPQLIRGQGSRATSQI